MRRNLNSERSELIIRAVGVKALDLLQNIETNETLWLRIRDSRIHEFTDFHQTTFRIWMTIVNLLCLLWISEQNRSYHCCVTFCLIASQPVDCLGMGVDTYMYHKTTNGALFVLIDYPEG